jgi:putative PIN family toxin of toxin-antitoxin system
MKVITDTNLFISALIFNGMVKSIFQLMLEDKIVLILSPDLLSEIYTKFNEFNADEVAMEKLGRIFMHKNNLLFSPNFKLKVCRDPEDNFLLELAQESKADFLITRDKDLLSLPKSKWQQTSIIKPEDFLNLLRETKVI